MKEPELIFCPLPVFSLVILSFQQWEALALIFSLVNYRVCIIYFKKWIKVDYVLPIKQPTEYQQRKI